ncbi:MAG: glycosyl transferase family 2 [Acidobacteria bacterium RIFCSPLOWO2_12_FULL_54_10]|nr:MAG: glycosyl transferase family 2 [Acidobacteria bacterium RIFCSPLOWO2_12_FULL_54_10]
MTVKAETVAVTIVTHNSELYVRRCLESVLSQDGPSLDIVVVDNASHDATCSIMERYQKQVRLIYNQENVGFPAAQNQAIQATSSDWVLVLNPDVLLTQGFITSLVKKGNLNASIGTVCGKLLRAGPGLSIPIERRLDSAGIYFTPTFRHFDRGMHELDGEEFNEPAFVFGSTAAAALYRRQMIQDVSIEGEFFDEEFFLYREDADLSWRAQLMGWKCLYFPEAVGYHVRRVFPDSRRELPALINLHSVKNRFLMRLKNVTGPLYMRNFLTVTARDLAILGYCLSIEQTSLKAFISVVKSMRRTWSKRRIIQQKRKVSDAYLRSWFRFSPAVIPVDLNSLPDPHAAAVARGTSSVLQVPARRANQSRLPQL